MPLFNRNKFQSLSKEQQHYHAAQSLRQIYEEVFEGEACLKKLQNYSQLREWIGLESWNSFDRKLIADEYHKHLKLSGRQHREHSLLPRIIKGDRTKPIKEALPVSIYLDNLRSAHNVGSIIRTVDAFSLGTIFFSKETPTPDNKQVQDTSMGAHEWINFKTIDTLTDLPMPLIALETTENACPVHEFSFPKAFTLALGNEEYGCSDAILKRASNVIAIPMYGRKNSLNVANAFAIIAAEIRHQLSSVAT